MFHLLLFTSCLAFALASPAPISQPSLIDSILKNPSIPEMTLADLGLNETLLSSGVEKRQTNLKITAYDIKFLDNYGLGSLVISDPVPTAPGTTNAAHPVDILLVPTQLPAGRDNAFCFYTDRYMLKLVGLIISYEGGACSGGISTSFDTTSRFNVTSNRIRAYLTDLSNKPDARYPRFKYANTNYYNDRLGGGIDIQFDDDGKISGFVVFIGDQMAPYNTNQFIVQTFMRPFTGTVSYKATIPFQ